MDVVAEVKRAIKYTENKEYAKAQLIYQDILKIDKNNSIVLSCLGLLYLNTKYFKHAERKLEQAEKIKPNLVTEEGLGLVKYYLGKYTEACNYFSKVIKYTKNFDVFDKYTKSLSELRMSSLEYMVASECVKRYPLKKESLCNMVMACIATGRLNDAVGYAEQVVKSFPKYGDAWIKFGLVNEMVYRNEEMAQACYKKALSCGDKQAAYYNLAINAHKRDDFKTAEYYAKKLIKFDSENSVINFLYATICFKQRKFKKAYKYYIKKDSDKQYTEHPISKLKRFWDGKTYKDEMLLVYCDQGIGDYMMFVRYLPLLTKKFKKIKLCTLKPVLNLFKRSFAMYKNIEVVERRKRFPHYDKSLILSNIPYFLNSDIDKIPMSSGYLIAEESKIEDYKEKYFNNTNKLKVGICWEAGSAGWREQINRTLNISLFDSILNKKDIQFYSLQVKPSLDNYKQYSGMIDLGKTFNDFDDTAAAIKNLDVVITVDTSVAHLAGAMGVNTFMLLPYCPDWRWFDNDKHTEWYDSVKIFKQKDTVSWSDVIENINNELSKLC